MPFFDYTYNKCNTFNYIVKWMIFTAKRLKDSIRYNFNGVMFTAYPGGSSIKSITRFYERESKKMMSEIEEDDVEERKDNHQSRTVKRRIVHFQVCDEKKWREIIKNNKKDMRGMLCFTSRWARIMEKHLRNGEKIEKICIKASHEADTDYISGSEFDCAVNILSGIWKYRKELHEYCLKKGL